MFVLVQPLKRAYIGYQDFLDKSLGWFLGFWYRSLSLTVWEQRCFEDFFGDNGPIYPSYLFIATSPHLKVTQLFFKVLNLPGYMVRWCGEQFRKQFLLYRPLCFQKTLHSTLNLSSYRPYQSSSVPWDPFFLHSNQNYDHFPNPLIKAFQDINHKMSHSYKIGDFIAGSSKLVPGSSGTILRC